MSQNTEPEASPSADFLSTYFPELAGEAPSKAELKEKVLELHEAGDHEAAAKILAWHEEQEESKKKPESKVSKAGKITIFVLAVAAAIFGTLWAINAATGSQNTSIIVCSINGSNYTGSDCSMDSNVYKEANQLNKEKEEADKAAKKDVEILEGTTDREGEE